MVISSAFSNRLALVLDSCLHVFQHDFNSTNTDAENISVDVNVRISAISWSPCGNFMLLALNSGHGQLVHLPTRVPLPSFPIVDSTKDNLVTSCNSSDDKISKPFMGCWINKEIGERCYTLVLLSADGQVRQLLKSRTHFRVNTIIMLSMTPPLNLRYTCIHIF